MHYRLLSVGSAGAVANGVALNESRLLRASEAATPGARSLFGHNEHSAGRKCKNSVANGFSDTYATHSASIRITVEEATPLSHDRITDDSKQQKVRESHCFS
jgi:hypothetical protein